MPGVDAMIREAEQSLGVAGRPNGITRDYARRNGSYFERAPWCNMAITEWARRSGNYQAVCFGTDYAYTVWHAQRFQKAGQWHYDTGGISRGSIVFFDWGGSNSIGRIDHVGIVTHVRGSAVYTIEGNTSDRCARRVRYASTIVGYGRPDYTSSGSSGSGEEDDVIGLKRGDKGSGVEALQVLIHYAGRGDALGKAGCDGDYGPKTAEALRRVRDDVGSEAAKGWGDKVTPWAYGQLMVAVAKKQG